MWGGGGEGNRQEMERLQRLATVGSVYYPQAAGIRRRGPCCVLDPLRAGAMEEGSPEGTAIMRSHLPMETCL